MPALALFLIFVICIDWDIVASVNWDITTYPPPIGEKPVIMFRHGVTQIKKKANQEVTIGGTRYKIISITPDASGGTGTIKIKDGNNAAVVKTMAELVSMAGPGNNGVAASKHSRYGDYEIYDGYYDDADDYYQQEWILNAYWKGYEQGLRDAIKTKKKRSSRHSRYSRLMHRK